MADRVVGEREERLREALEAAFAIIMEPLDEREKQGPTRIDQMLRVEHALRTALREDDAALASSPSPPLLDGAECHELYSMWLAHNAGEGVDPDHPLVTAGEKLAQRMDPGHPRFSGEA